MLYFYGAMILQIVVESFPISSSGHVQLWQMFLMYMGVWRESVYAVFCPIALPLSTLKRAFDYALHGPTLVILALFFFDRWWVLVRYCRRTWRMILRIFMLGVCADAITALWYGIFAYCGTAWFPLSIGFLITGCCLYALRWRSAPGKTSVSMRAACVIGCVQGIALLPGISRMGVTYAVGRYMGLRARTALEFSLLIQYPLILAGFLYGVYTLGFVGMQTFFSVKTLSILLGASIASYYALGLTMRWACAEKLWRLAYYMIIPLLASIILTIALW